VTEISEPLSSVTTSVCGCTCWFTCSELAWLDSVLIESDSVVGILLLWIQVAHFLVCTFAKYIGHTFRRNSAPLQQRIRNKTSPELNSAELVCWHWDSYSSCPFIKVHYQGGTSNRGMLRVFLPSRLFHSLPRLHTTRPHATQESCLCRLESQSLRRLLASLGRLGSHDSHNAECMFSIWGSHPISWTHVELCYNHKLCVPLILITTRSMRMIGNHRNCKFLKRALNSTTVHYSLWGHQRLFNRIVQNQHCLFVSWFGAVCRVLVESMRM